MDEPALAIGYLCIVYAYLEQRISIFLGALTGLSDDNLKCVTNQVDMLKEVSIVRALGFLHQPSPVWYSDLELILWVVEQYAMPLRNRFVHDRWLANPAGGAMRRYDRTKLRREKPSAPSELTTHEYVPYSADDIWDLTNLLADVGGALEFLRRDLKARRQGRQGEPLPQQLRDHLHARKNTHQERVSKGQTSPVQASAVSRKT